MPEIKVISAKLVWKTHSNCKILQNPYKHLYGKLDESVLLEFIFVYFRPIRFNLKTGIAMIIFFLVTKGFWVSNM